MSDLPSRNVARVWAERLRHQQYDFVPKLPAVMQAYADGELMARQEFIDSLDYEAALDSIPQWIRDTLGDMLVPDSLVRIIVTAALGEDTE